MGNKIEIIQNPKISSIYFGLLVSGYDFYSVEKDQETVNQLERFRSVNISHKEFFSQARQRTCEVYPFWPRAALLETASFLVDEKKKCFTDFNRYYQEVINSDKLLDIEKNREFWEWVKILPEVLSDIMSSSAFQQYLDWETGWLEHQNEKHKEALDFCEKAVSSFSEQSYSSERKVRVILCPIKCSYSADYYNDKDSFYVISGTFNGEATLHEYLHTLIHPLAVRHRDEALTFDFRNAVNIDQSYYLEQDDNGKFNAFEEALVRSATKEAVKQQRGFNLESYLTELLEKQCHS